MNSELFSRKKKPYKERYKGKLRAYFRKHPVPDAKLSTAFRFYRYISLLLTSLFFLLEPSPSAPLFKVGAVGLLAALTILVLQGYKRYHKNIAFVSMLILLETMCIVLLIMISGGLESAGRGGILE